MATKRSNGEGCIHRRANGTWEARVTVGRDPATGKLLRKSIYGKTQKEVCQKKQAMSVAVNERTYSEPSARAKMPLSEWLDIWLSEYLINTVKPRTVDSYRTNIKKHIVPAIGAVKLCDLSKDLIQEKLYNRMQNAVTKEPLSAKTKKNVHGTLHAALDKARELGYIRTNPADKPSLPKVRQKEIHPFDEAQTAQFLKLIRGHYYEDVYTLILFTGLRAGEALGLTWDEINFAEGTITVKHQLQKRRGTGGKYELTIPKNSKARVLYPPSHIIKLLETRKAQQTFDARVHASFWQNPLNLVFTHGDGKNFCLQTVYLEFKKLVEGMGLPEMRVHDLRHTYATLALKNGDSIKDVQEALGHATAAFTMSVYCHVTEEMKKTSRARQEAMFERMLQQA